MRYVSFILLWMMFITASAQQSGLVEYWVDNPTSKQSTNMSGGKWDSEIDISSIKNGIHTLTMRVKDNNGKWSTPNSTLFVKESHPTSLQTVEYWIDSADKRTTKAASGNVFNTDIDASSLSEGMHTFTYRVKYNDGDNWSLPNSLLFVKESYPTSLQTVEYWIDSADKRTTKAASGNVFNTDIDVSSLSEGMHTFTYRVKYNDGDNWSLPNSLLFVKESYPTSLQTVEYWIDSADKRTTKAASGNVFNTDIDMSSLSEGMHTFTYRVKYNYGKWSAPRTSVFTKDMFQYTSKQITEYEYWINKHISNRVSTKIDTPQSPYNWNTILTLDNQYLETSDESIMLIPDSDGKNFIGNRNTITYRFKDSSGAWTELRTDTFGIVNTKPEVNISNLIINPSALDKNNGWTTTGTIANFIRKGEHYRNDTSPYFSLGNVNNEGWTAAMSQTINGLPAGTYKLAVKARGTVGVKAYISANNARTELSVIGSEGGSVWQSATNGSVEKERNGGKGFGWNEDFITVITDGGPLVISVEGQATTKNCHLDVVDFELYKNEASSFKAVFDSSVDMNTYKGMTLKLQTGNTSTQVTLDANREYTFNGIPEDIPITLSLINSYGQTLWVQENYVIDENGYTLSISGITPVIDVCLEVDDLSAKNITDKVNIIWYDADNNKIANGSIIINVANGSKIGYGIELGDSLGVIYTEPEIKMIEVNGQTKTQRLTLTEVEKTRLTGTVTYNGSAIEGAKVSIKQLVNGKYSLTTEIKTSADGKIDMMLPNVPCYVTISATDYYDVSKDMPKPADMGNISLEKVTGKGISLDLKVIERTTGDTPAEPSYWYAGYNNLKISVVNLSHGDAEIPFTLQNNSILPQNAVNGDVLKITVTDYNGRYIGASCDVTYNTDNAATASLTLVELGAIQVSTIGSDNAGTEYIIYDENGVFVTSASVAGSHSHLIENLKAGSYTVVGIGQSNLLGMFGNLYEFSDAGLKEGYDYVTANVTVTDALTSEAMLSLVPKIDERNFYYTSENTSFTVNKTTTLPGSYVTYTVRLEFKEEYAADIDKLSLVVNIPDGMRYVENSSIVGMDAAMANISANKLTISLNKENYLQRIRFCLVPTKSGITNTNAFVEFNSGKLISQPIGRITVEAEEFEIKVPSVTSKPNFKVSGTAIPNSSVKVFDGETELCTVTPLMDGTWTASVELFEPRQLSSHTIYAVISTSAGDVINTPQTTVKYDINKNFVNTVTMINTAHPATSLRTCEYRTVFDFVNPSTQAAIYWYWPKYPSFTFLVDFANNSPERVDNVWVKVKTTAGTEKIIKANYDARLDKWVATEDFYSAATPVNVCVKYDTHNDKLQVDMSSSIAKIKEMYSSIDNLLQREKNYKNAEAEINQILSDFGTIDVDEYDRVLNKYGLGDSEEDDINASLSDDAQKILDKMLACEDESEYNQLFSELLNKELPDLDLLDNSSEVIDLYENLLQGNRVLLDGQAYTFKMMEEAEFIKIKDEDFRILETIENGKIYLKVTECEIAIYDPSSRLLFIKESNMNQQGSEMRRAKLFAEFIDTVVEINDSIYSKYEQLYTKHKDLIEGVKAVGGYITKDKKKLKAISKKFSSLKGHLKGWHVKTKIVIDCTISRLSYFEKAAAAARFIELPKLSHDFTYYATILVHSWNEKNKAEEEVINCLGEEDGAFLLNEISDRFVYIKTNLQSYLWASAGAIMYNILEILDAIEKKRTKLQRLIEQIDKLTEEVFKKLELGFSIWEPSVEFSFDNVNELYQDDLKKVEQFVDAGYKDILAKMDKSKCKNDDEPEDPDDEWDPDNLPPMCMIEESKSPNSQSVLDPSGYVYEAVTSNRLAGVTASIYQEGAGSAPWNAAIYNQVNPQITDESGVYAWDVPMGNWQVRFVKEGYDPAATPWLPVPPPQLDINIPMVNASNPKVKEAVGYPSGINVTFEKYMKPTTVTVNEVSVKRGANAVVGKIEYTNMEEAPNTNETFASKIKFVPEKQFVVGEEVELHINKNVKSYADMPMMADAVIKVKIEPEITDLLAGEQITVAPGEVAQVDVFALPAESAEGQYLNIDNASSLFTQSTERVRFDKEGKASFSISGNIIGSAPMRLWIEGTELEVYTTVKVTNDGNVVATPKASIPSGSKVEPGTQVILSCSTSGSTIYYTLDGSCPCSSASRVKYTEPIEINDATELKVQAFKEGLEDSKVATFIYSLTTGMNDIGQKISVYAETDDIVIKGCNGQSAQIYDTRGQQVWNCEKMTGTHRVRLPRNNVYIVNIKNHDGIMKITKIIL